MPANRTVRTSSAATAQRALPTALPSEAEEPMRIWPHPISTSCPTPSRGSACGDLSQVLEQLHCQNQLLVDLLGAVNSLTAATLCRGERSAPLS